MNTVTKSIDGVKVTYDANTFTFTYELPSGMTGKKFTAWKKANLDELNTIRDSAKLDTLVDDVRIVRESNSTHLTFHIPTHMTGDGFKAWKNRNQSLLHILKNQKKYSPAESFETKSTSI